MLRIQRDQFVRDRSISRWSTAFLQGASSGSVARITKLLLTTVMPLEMHVAFAPLIA